MGVIAYSRARSAVALVFGLLLLVIPTRLPAAVFGPMVALELKRLSTEPFGLIALAITEGGLHEKWRGLQRTLDEEQRLLDECRNDRTHCSSPAALRFLAIIDSGRNHEGLARFGDINRAINMAIKPVSDVVNYGMVDVWSSPLTTLANGSGDCEDYAIAKLVALKEAGVASDDLRLVIVRDIARSEDHAVVAARLEGRWLVLDNRRLIMLEDAQLAGYLPTFVIDSGGVRRYLEPGPAAEPTLMSGSGQPSNTVLASNSGFVPK